MLLKKIWAYEVYGNMRVEKNTHNTASWFVLITRHYSNDQMKKNEMGGACGTRRGGKKSTQGFVGKN
jgi:hypothetical protein